MDDLISRQAAIDAFGVVDDAFLMVAVIKARLKGLPSAQVTCLDCKYHIVCWKLDYCTLYGQSRHSDDYCSRAERRKEDE